MSVPNFGPLIRPVRLELSLVSGTFFAFPVAQSFSETLTIFGVNEADAGLALYDGPDSALQKILTGSTSGATADFRLVPVSTAGSPVYYTVGGVAWADGLMPGTFYLVQRTGSGPADPARSILWTVWQRHRWWNLTAARVDGQTGTPATFTLTIDGDTVSSVWPTDAASASGIAADLVSKANASALAGFTPYTWTNVSGGSVNASQGSTDVWDSSGTRLGGDANTLTTDFVETALTSIPEGHVIREIHSEVDPGFLPFEPVTLSDA